MLTVNRNLSEVRGKLKLMLVKASKVSPMLSITISAIDDQYADILTCLSRRIDKVGFNLSYYTNTHRVTNTRVFYKDLARTLPLHIPYTRPHTHHTTSHHTTPRLLTHTHSRTFRSVEPSISHFLLPIS